MKGTYLNLIPFFPLAAVAPLAGNGIYTVEDLDAKVAEIQKRTGRKDASRYTAVTEAGLSGQLVLDIAKALPGNFGPAEPRPNGKPSKDKPAAIDSVVELLPCPFCGSKKIEERPLLLQMRAMQCQVCFSRGPEAAEAVVARDFWNKRATK